MPNKIYVKLSPIWFFNTKIICGSFLSIFLLCFVAEAIIMSVFSSDVIGRIVICGNALAARLLLHPNTRNKPTFQIYQTTMGGLDRMLKKTMKNYRWHNQEKRALSTVNMTCLSKLWNLTHLLKTLLAAKFTSIPVHVGSVKIGDFQRPPGWGRCGSGWTGSTRGRPSSTSPPPTVNSGWRWHRLPQSVIFYICVVISSIHWLLAMHCKLSNAKAGCDTFLVFPPTSSLSCYSSLDLFNHC